MRIFYKGSKMNWGIRITAVLVILGGLIWLNWDRISEGLDGNELSVQMLEEQGEGHAVDLRISREPETEQSDSETHQNNAEDVSSKESAVSSSPGFVLQPAPESLNDSDTQVRSVLEEVSSAAIEWLKPEEQIRKWSLLVTQAAEGNTLYMDRPFAFELAEFAVEERGERYFVSAQNFERYDAVVGVLTNLPADKLVAYYRDWYPLFETAFGELGLSGDFDERVESMIERIIAVKVLEAEIELKKPSSVTYKFLDPTLEGASQIDKWLWRMGPENTRKIQNLASQLKRELEKR